MHDVELPPAPPPVERIANGEVEVPPGVVPVETTNPDDLWTRRDSLAHLMRFAHSRNVNPWGMLGCVLARVIASTPPTLVTPPLIGGYGSLNIFIALTANSGGGKGACMSAARDAVEIVDATGGFPVHVPEINSGTGEGLVRLFMEPPAPKKDELPTPRITRALVNESEVSNLDALAGRSGSTVVPTLLKMWSGEQAGFNNSSADTRSNVEAHTYRLGMITQVQPANAPAILKHEDSGLPQRYVWLPAWMEDTGQWIPETVPPLKVELTTPRDQTVMDLPESVKTYVVADYRRRSSQAFNVDADPLEGHRTMLRIKIACGLALLEGHTDVDLEDWELAGVVLLKHTDTLGLVRRELATKARREAEQRTQNQREAEIARLEKMEARARSHVVRRLEAGEGTVNVAACRYAAKSDLRKLVPEVFEALEAEGLITVTGEGTRAVAQVHGPQGVDRVREWSNRSNGPTQVNGGM
ncbi:hypothetical protein [Corynebacterium efficiens]|nr:hypothetical protein [Corynebacterium efficiens]